MLSFPGEEERCEEVQHALASEFEFAERMYGFWLRLRKDDGLEHSRLPTDCRHVAMLLNVQACRQFRSVLEQCKRSEGLCANILTRSLYETVLALLFILKPCVRIVVEPEIKCGVPQSTYRARAPGRTKKGMKSHQKYPNRQLRARLYLAHLLFREAKLSKKLSTLPGTKRFGRKQLAEADPSLTADYKKMIGPNWSSVLSNSQSYSGLKVADLARVVGPSMLIWYERVYGIQSSIAHGADALRHAELKGGKIQAIWISCNGETTGALRLAVTLFMVCMLACQKYIGFGPNAGMAIEGLNDEFRRLVG